MSQSTQWGAGMSLSELTDRNAVLAAIREYDLLGQEAFLAKYGYSQARRYQLIHEGKPYDSKAIVGVAFGNQFPERGPLQHSDFSGGDATVVPILQKLNFTVQTSEKQDRPASVSAEDVLLIRQSRAKVKYSELSPDERAAYNRVHEGLQQLGSIARDNLNQPSNYSVKLTSGFYPNSGIRGGLPKDLWFAVSNQRNYDVWVGMPQLFMIVSERGVEYGFAASIHPSDFSIQAIKQRVREVAPEIFKELPQPGSPGATALDTSLVQTGRWYLRKKTRLEPNINDFSSLDQWLTFLKSPASAKDAAGAISRYISIDELTSSALDFPVLMKELATVFSDTMDKIVAPAQPTNPIQNGLEQLLTVYPSFRSTVAFGQHEQLKNVLNRLRSSVEALPALREHPRVRVSWSVGQGDFARIPWIALMDERETTSTQRGIYCAFLFSEDMSGVYLTLIQGATTTVDESGRMEARRILRQQAEAMREIVRPQLQSFSLNNDLDLHTDGVLGQDYEASTIAYRHYSTGAVPEDAALNDDIDQLLTAYNQILQQRPAAEQESIQWWIFQSNPKIYNIDGAVRDLSELTWTVKHEALRASVGDRVFFWRAGREAGVIALGTIIEAPAGRDNLPAEEKYLLSPERLGGTQSRVLVRVDQRLDEVLLRTAIAADPRLRDLMILRFANYSTFKVLPHHADAILELIDNIEQPPPDVIAETARRMWIYAPGENAEFWDAFYEGGFMAIGWDSLGDLSQYGSLEDVLAALKNEYQSEGRPTNNARTCYDFVHTIRAGDRVFVKRGRNTIIGYGTVTGDYEYRADRSQFKNVRTVRWEGRGTWTSPAPVAIKTLTDVTGDTAFVNALEQMVGGAITGTPKPIPVAVRDPYTVEQALDGLFLDAETFRRSLAIWHLKKNLILQGPPGVGKSFIARRLAYALMGYRDPSRVRTVQFHQSYSYEDFIQGYRPSESGLTLQQGVFLEFCEKALSDPNEMYVFTIDEINRGNISKILGELMLLIEPDKRSPEWATKLAYSPAAEERFYVPPNVYLLGMMNTADRSLSFVDYALRRRFAFVTLRPEYSSNEFRQDLIHRGAEIQLVDRIVSRMSALNDDIAGDQTNLGYGFCIGHSFFCAAGDDEALGESWYKRVIDTEIVPLLEEYWFDNPDRANEWHRRLIAE